MSKTSLMKKCFDFDFDIGHIIKSPCKDCPRQAELPGCAEKCAKIDKIQSILLGCVSCSNNYSEVETYTISMRKD